MRTIIPAILLALVTANPVRAQTEVDYLVITPDCFAPEFDSFVAWKTRKGMRTEVVSTESILIRSSGRDGAEKVRNFIRLWHDSLGVRWVLLGGEPELVPARRARAAGQDVPCDLYFSDLDGDWDADGDGIYGESSDSVDMYTDVFVGRAPASLVVEIKGILSKWLHYELDPAHRSLNRLLKFDDTTGLNPPPGWTTALLVPPVERYEFRDSLRSGFDLVLYRGSGEYDRFRTAGGMTILDMADAAGLDNYNRLSVLLTNAVNVGNFTMDCILGVLLKNPGGGSVAAMGNSGLAYTMCSGLYHAFFDCLFRTDTLPGAGRHFARASDSFVPLARTSQPWRLELYGSNLLGDPELPVHTDTLRTLAVEHPVVLDTGPRDFPVTIRSGGAPCRGFVCLWKGDEVYERRWLDGSGSISVHARTPGELLVTATALNHRPYLGSCGVAAAVKEESTGPLGARRPQVSPNVSLLAPSGGWLLDIAGRRVMALRPGRNDVGSLSPGIYFVRQEENRTTAKVVILR